jgi:hypothetical protein
MQADKERGRQTSRQRTALAQLEKEVRFVLNELWAKVSAKERFVAYGVAAVVVGWILGTIFGSTSVGGGSYAGITVPGVTVNYFSWANAGLFGILALLLGIVTGVILYLKIAPNMNITWPMPVSQILLGAAVATLVCAVLMTLMHFTGPSGAPVLMYVADVLMIGGGAAMSWFEYQEWMASKTAV